MHEDNKLSTPIYARDIKTHLLNDQFFGEGFSKLLQKADETEKEIIVGLYYYKPFIDD